MGYCLGWDIGGSNIKATLVSIRDPDGVVKQINHYYEMWHDYQQLANTLTLITNKMIPITDVSAIAVTITAELADAFRTKEAGIRYVIQSLEKAFPYKPIYVLTTDATFVQPNEALAEPLKVSAANWVATSAMIARKINNCFLMDMGSTTVDIIPIEDGTIAAKGKTDPERLATGELVFTGMLRNNVCSLVTQVPVDGRWLSVSSEYFVNTGDVHLLLNHISAEQYTANTPDGRPSQYEFALERLSRLICADINMITEESLVSLARYVSEKQIQRIVDSLYLVVSRFPQGHSWPVIVTGLGDHLCRVCVERLGMEAAFWNHVFHDHTSLAAPSYAVAYLLSEELNSQ